MVAEIFAARSPLRRLAPLRLLVAVVALCALVALGIEVIAPLSAGLPAGWGQFDKPAFHLHSGIPPFWNVVADTSLSPGATSACASAAVVASPPTERALQATVDAMKAPRWMAIVVKSPCRDQSAGGDTQAALWQPTGQVVGITGQRALLKIETVGAPPDQLSCRGGCPWLSLRFLLAGSVSGAGTTGLARLPSVRALVSLY